VSTSFKPNQYKYHGRQCPPPLNHSHIRWEYKSRCKTRRPTDDLGIALLEQYTHALSSLHMTLPLVHRLNDIQLMAPWGKMNMLRKTKKEIRRGKQYRLVTCRLTTNTGVRRCLIIPICCEFKSSSLPAAYSH
jgi:hypothetical protein